MGGGDDEVVLEHDAMLGIGDDGGAGSCVEGGKVRVEDEVEGAVETEATIA